MRTLIVLLASSLFACSSSSSDGNAKSSDAGNTQLSDGGREDGSTGGDVAGEPDMEPPDGPAATWCPAGQILDPDGGEVLIEDLGASRESLHAVGSCPGSAEACWFVADVSAGAWEQTTVVRAPEAETFVDVGCSPVHCLGVTATTAYTSDGESVEPFAVPDIGDSTFVAAGTGFTETAFSGSNGELWFLPEETAPWQTLDFGRVSDFGSHAGTLRYAFGDAVVQLNDATWAVTDFAEDLEHGALAADTIFGTSGARYVAVNTGFTRNATSLSQLGRVAAVTEGLIDYAIIAAGDRIIAADTNNGATPRNETILPAPADPIVAVAFTVTAAAWAVTSSGELYRRVAAGTCP